MTDRELLELAAKAAGIEIEWNVMINLNSPFLAPKTQQERNWLGHEHTPWNPLIEDGDALRLAVKLNLDIICGNGASFARMPNGRSKSEPHGDGCPYAATRRAIVRAAAEVGKQMEAKP